MPAEFVALSKNAWDPHPVNITHIGSVLQNYHTLATSDRGPQVVEHRNTIAVQFHVDPKYKESVAILENFVSNKIEAIHSSEIETFLLEEAEALTRVALFKYSAQAGRD